MPFFQGPDNTQLHFKRYGDPSCPAIILIHGLAANLNVWRPQITELSTKFNVYAIDLPGHGLSNKKPSYSVHKIPALIKAFMDFYELKQVNLVGLSIGSTAVLLFAAEYPDSVKSMVLEGPSAGIVPFWNPAAWPSYLQLQFTVKTVLLLWAFFGKKRAGVIINWIGKTSKYAQFLTLMEEQTDERALIDYSFTNADAPLETCGLEKITAPALIIRGVEEQFPKSYSQYVSDRLIASMCLWLEIPNAQHLVSLTNPLEFNLMLMAFLERVNNLNIFDLQHCLHENAASVFKEQSGRMNVAH